MSNRARVVIEVRGGVAEVTSEEGEVDVVVVDHDNGEVLPGDDAPDPKDDPEGYIAATLCCPSCGEDLRGGVQVLNEVRTKQIYEPETNDWSESRECGDPQTVEVSCLHCCDVLPVADEMELRGMLIDLEH